MIALFGGAFAAAPAGIENAFIDVAVAIVVVIVALLGSTGGTSAKYTAAIIAICIDETAKRWRTRGTPSATV